MRIILLFILLGIGSFISAQEQILSIKDIEQNERKTIKAIEKFQKRSKKKKIKEQFISQYNNSVSNLLSRYNILSSDNQFEDKNWEGMINSLKTLQYLNTLVKSSDATSFISAKDYSSKIDSVSKLAQESLYNKGKQILDKDDNDDKSQEAYGYLKRVSQIEPDYLNTKALMELAVMRGSKNIYFSPVRYDNLGNYIEWGTGNSSMSSDYIINSLVDDLSVDNAGSRFVENSIDADWIIEMKWMSVDISPETTNKKPFERSAKIKENGIEKTVNATVTYTERYKTVSGTFKLKMKDVSTQDYFISEEFSGTTFFTKVEAKYTGDKRALTNEDSNVINNTNNFYFTIEGYELTTKMYSNAIHQQVLDKIGRLINWNYNVGINYKEGFGW